MKEGCWKGRLLFVFLLFANLAGIVMIARQMFL